VKIFSDNIKVYIGLFSAMFFWGLSFVGTKYSLNSLNPVSLVLVRLIISVIFLLILGKSLNLLNPILPQHRKLFIFLAFLEPFLYFMGETYGLKYVSSTIGSLIISTIPLFVPLGSWLFFKNKIQVKNFIGIILSILGVFLTMLNKNMSFTASFLGIGLVFIAVFSAVAYTLIIKYIAEYYSALSIITYQNILGIPFFIVTFFITDYHTFSFSNFNLQLIIVLLLLGIFPSSLSYLFYTYSVKKLGVNKTSVFVNLIPIVTAIGSYIFFNETFTLIKVLGIIIVILGLYISQYDFERKQNV